jgi:hypothetical protein
MGRAFFKHVIELLYKQPYVFQLAFYRLNFYRHYDFSIWQRLKIAASTIANQQVPMKYRSLGFDAWLKKHKLWYKNPY